MRRRDELEVVWHGASWRDDVAVPVVPDRPLRRTPAGYAPFLGTDVKIATILRTIGSHPMTRLTIRQRTGLSVDQTDLAMTEAMKRGLVRKLTDSRPPRYIRTPR